MLSYLLGVLVAASCDQADTGWFRWKNIDLIFYYLKSGRAEAREQGKKHCIHSWIDNSELLEGLSVVNLWTSWRTQNYGKRRKKTKAQDMWYKSFLRCEEKEQTELMCEE